MVVAVAALHQHIQARNRLPLELGAAGGAVEIADLLAGVAIVLEAAAVLGHAGDAKQQGVVDRPGDEGLGAAVAIGAHVSVEASAVAAGRAVADEVDGAAGGVAAVQGALGSAQHLHPRQVEDLAGGLDRERIGHLVDIDAHRG